jgi:phosphatidylserine/phosphatidylglycerophosphate/cardiolipin synthase-like enzyme
MSTDTIELFLPCEVLEVNVAVAPSNKVTSLEQYVLRALVDPDVNSIEALTSLFGLGHRPMLNLVLGLWRNGYVEVLDPVSQIALTQVARDHLDRLRDLPSDSELTHRKERVLRELVSGHLMEMQPHATTAIRNRTAPIVQPSGIGSEADRAELLQVLMKRKRTTFGDRPEKLIEVHLPITPTGTPAPSRSRTIRVLARVWEDLDAGRTQFDIVHPGDIPVLVRRDIGAKLSQMSREQPSEIFFKQLSDFTAKTAQSELTLEDALERLEARVRKLNSIETGTAPVAHQECVRLADNVTALLREIAAPVQIEELAGSDEIVDAILRAIKTTDKQLVLACPFLHVRGYQRFRDALIALITERPVDVFLLWGVSQDAELGSALELALQGIRKGERLGRLHYVEVPTRTHAKVVVRDADWAFVGSLNFLSWQETPLAEAGIAVQSLDGTACPAVLSLLEWARSVFPDYSSGRYIRVTAGEFDSPPHSLQDQPELLLPEYPPAPRAKESVASVASLNIWRRGWQEFLEALLHLSDPRNLADTRVRVVADEDHRTWLWRALNKCRDRILIASDGLSDDVVDDRFLHTLRRRLESDHVDVTLIFRRARELGALQRLAEAFPDRLNLVQAANHAKILAWDDRALVSSFNFLSFEGVYQGQKRRRVRSEIGMLVEGPDAYALAMGLLARQLAELRVHQRRVLPATPSSTAAAVPIQAGASTSDVLAVLNRLANDEDTERRGTDIQSVFDGFQTARDAVSALERLESAGVESASLAVVASAFLLRRDCDNEWEARVRWLRTLAVDAWHADRRFECAILLLDLGDDNRGADLPSFALAQLASVAQSPGALLGRFAEVAASARDDAEMEALAIVAAVATLMSGAAEAAMALALLCPAIRQPDLQRWLKSIYSYWERSGVRLPLASLRQRLDARETAMSARHSRDKLLDAFRAAMTRDFDFMVGRQTWGELFSAGKPLYPLRVAAETHDAAAAAEWVKRYGTTDADIADLMDRASERGTRGTKHAGEYVDGGRRRAYLGLLRDIVRAARDWVVAQRVDTHDDARVIEETLRLGVELSASEAAVKTLFGVRAGSRHISTPLIGELRQVVEPLFALGKEEKREGAADE